MSIWYWMNDNIKKSQNGSPVEIFRFTYPFYRRWRNTRGRNYATKSFVKQIICYNDKILLKYRIYRKIRNAYVNFSVGSTGKNYLEYIDTELVEVWKQILNNYNINFLFENKCQYTGSNSRVLWIGNKFSGSINKYFSCLLQ